jgi:hypothetical protein
VRLGPRHRGFEGTWRLTLVNDQALPPVLGNATGEEVWVAALLELSGLQQGHATGGVASTKDLNYSAFG